MSVGVNDLNYYRTANGVMRIIFRMSIVAVMLHSAILNPCYKRVEIAIDRESLIRNSNRVLAQFDNEKPLK